MVKYSVSIEWVVGILMAFVLGLEAQAQSGSGSVRLANLEQDFRILEERLSLMSAELENVRRENASLRTQLVGDAVSRSELEAIARQLENRDEKIRGEIVDTVNVSMNDMLKQVREIVGNGRVSNEPRSIEHPDEGFVHLVKAGDSLYSIASQYESRVDWLRAANGEKTKNDLIKVGDELFVPVE